MIPKGEICVSLKSKKNEYTISMGKLIGKGRYAEVRLFYSLGNKPYVIKINNKNPELKSIEYECYVLYKLGYLQEYFFDPNTSKPCFKIDYFPGVPLTYFKNNILRFPSILNALNVGLSLIEQLAKIHRLGFIHNDIKYSNIIYDEKTCQIILIDFGSCMPIKTKWIPSNRGKKLCHHLAPEQHTAQKNNNTISAKFSMDVYSLGVIFRNSFEQIHGITILRKLINDMLHPNPKSRPSLNQIYYIWHQQIIEYLQSKSYSKVFSLY